MKNKTNLLVVLRHAESKWNELGLWTGLKDISLTEKGMDEAKKTAQKLQGIVFHKSYVSELKRAKETLDIIVNTLHLSSIPIIAHKALNERNYGIYTGMNKWDVKIELGDNEFEKIRRSWNYPICRGETLEDVYNRVVPYYKEKIQTSVLTGENVLIVAHGNSLRALVKYLENLNEKEVVKLEISTAEAYVYELNDFGNIISKEIRF